MIDILVIALASLAVFVLGMNFGKWDVMRHPSVKIGADGSVTVLYRAHKPNLSGGNFT